MSELMGTSHGPDSVWQDGPLVVLAGGPGVSASQDDLVCHLEGGLSPPPGAPGSREDRDGRRCRHRGARLV